MAKNEAYDLARQENLDIKVELPADLMEAKNYLETTMGIREGHPMYHQVVSELEKKITNADRLTKVLLNNRLRSLQNSMPFE